MIIQFLNLKLALRKFRLKLELAQCTTAATNSHSLSTEKQILEDKNQALALRHEFTNWIRAQLRKTPPWIGGHLELGRVSLAANNIALAYASAQAAQLLSPESTSKRGEAQALVGLCYLKRGAFDQAKKILDEAFPINKNNHAFLEDLAACEIGLGNFSRAFELLSSIRSNQISAEGLAALRYCSDKVHGAKEPRFK